MSAWKKIVGAVAPALGTALGGPMAGAAVNIDFVEGAAAPIRLEVRSDDLGQFKIASVVPAEYTLTVYKPGYRLHRERIAFNPQSAAPVVRMRQERGVEVRGRDAAGHAADHQYIDAPRERVRVL